MRVRWTSWALGLWWPGGRWTTGESCGCKRIFATVKRVASRKAKDESYGIRDRRYRAQSLGRGPVGRPLRMPDRPTEGHIPYVIVSCPPDLSYRPMVVLRFVTMA